MLNNLQKSEIIVKHNNGMSDKQISDDMKLHRNVISFWINRYYDTNSVENKKRTGRKRKTTEKEDLKMIEIVNSNDKYKVSDVIEKMKDDSFTKNISESTVCRRLNGSGYVYGNYAKKPILTEKHKKERLAWAKEHIDYDWSKVIFSDEMSIWKDRYADKCWYITGNQKIKRMEPHPIKVHIWGCITLGGFEKYSIFTENQDADKYEEILFEHLLPIYTDNFIFQQDNSPVHTSIKIKHFFKKFNIKIIKFPAKSPDLNPIENLWHIIKHNMSKLSNVTNDNFVEKIRICCNNIDYSIIFNTISSMHIRIIKVISNNGDSIDY